MNWGKKPADKKAVSSISKAETGEEVTGFWGTHSLADYDDQTYEVEMTFDPAAQRACACCNRARTITRRQ